MKCDQCDYVFINGVGCHEIGCPNKKRRNDCFICGYPITDEDTHEGGQDVCDAINQEVA